MKTYGEELMAKASVVGSWAILIIVVFIYALQAYPNTSGIDFLSSFLGSLFGAWVIGAFVLWLVAITYKAVSGTKLQGFNVVVPLIATGLVVIALLVL